MDNIFKIKKIFHQLSLIRRDSGKLNSKFMKNRDAKFFGRFKIELKKQNLKIFFSTFQIDIAYFIGSKRILKHEK